MSLYFGVFISLFAYLIGMKLKKKFGWPVLNPLLVAIILVIAVYFADIRRNPVVDAAFRGMRPAVVALILAPVFSLGRGMHRALMLVAAAAALAIWLLDLSPIYVILAGAAGGILWELANIRKLRP